MSNLFPRMLRAAKLEAALYEEVEADKSATGQALVVVALSAIAAAIGSISAVGTTGILIGSIVAVGSWFVWALLTYVIGTKILPSPQTQSDVGELLRTIGFSSAPGAIRVLGVIPGVQSIVFFVAGIWMLASMVIAVRQALDYTSTLRAVAVCAVGWVVQLVLLVAVSKLLS
ncbi:MAG: hypothetical protein HYT87_14765 [Nitrospirae bacterium]|nr:hypothetical protein [Nitrospirota bacterium]